MTQAIWKFRNIEAVVEQPYKKDETKMHNKKEEKPKSKNKEKERMVA